MDEQMEEAHISSNSSTVQAGSEAGGSGKSTPGLTTTSGMAALKAQRARLNAANKLKAQFKDPGNVTGQTIIGKGATFTESAKIRWVQSMNGVTDFFGSMKQTRKIGHNKVYATSASTMSNSTSSSSGGGSTGSILSTVGFDAPVHSIPKPASIVVSPKGREHDKETSVRRGGHDPEVSARRGHHHHHTNNRTTPSHEHHHHEHHHGHGHGHGHAHSSASNSVVTSPVVSPRPETHRGQDASVSPTSQHSHSPHGDKHADKHRHSDAAPHDDHKHRSGGGGIATEHNKKRTAR